MLDHYSWIKEKNGATFVWLGQRALDCIGLHQLIDFKLILCCDYGLETEQVALRSGAKVISVEKNSFLRENWSNQDISRLFSRDMVWEVSKSLQAIDHPLIVAYCSVPALERLIARNHRMRLLAAPSKLKQMLDNKIYFRSILPMLGIAPLPADIIPLSSITYDAITAKYKAPFVVQMPFGSSGNASHKIDKLEDFKDLIRKHPFTEGIVSRFIDGPSPNVHAVVLDNDILVSYPSVQLIGIKECSRHPFAYCGNDFQKTRNLSAAVLNKLYDQTRAIGNWLRGMGFRGLFGLDFIVDSNEIYPVEINPRFQGSTQLLTDAQIRKKELPLAYFHLLAFIKDAIRIPIPSQMHFDSINASQIVLHNRHKHACRVQGTLEPGVYQYQGRASVFQRPGVSLSDCDSENDFVVTCAVPRYGTLVEADAPLLKLHLPFSALDESGKKLNTKASQIVSWIYSSLDLVAI